MQLAELQNPAVQEAVSHLDKILANLTSMQQESLSAGNTDKDGEWWNARPTLPVRKRSQTTQHPSTDPRTHMHAHARTLSHSFLLAKSSPNTNSRGGSRPQASRRSSSCAFSSSVASWGRASACGACATGSSRGASPSLRRCRTRPRVEGSITAAATERSP